jgi:cell division protein FtsB
VRVAFVIVLIVAIGAAAGGWLLYSRNRVAQVEDQKKIAELQQQLESLQAENTQLKDNLAKSQREEERLSTANQELAKALAQARLTGKIPPLPPSALPYPPK